MCVGKSEADRPHAVLWTLFTAIIFEVCKSFLPFMLLRHFEFSVIIYWIYALHYYQSENQSMLCHKITIKQTFLAFSQVYNTLDKP